MTTVTRIVGFALALVVVFLLALGLGRVVGPLGDAGSTLRHSAPTAPAAPADPAPASSGTTSDHGDDH